MKECHGLLRLLPLVWALVLFLKFISRPRGLIPTYRHQCLTASTYSSLPPGAAAPVYCPGSGGIFALGAAGKMLAAGHGSTATTTAANCSGNYIAGHVESTVPSTAHSPFARMDPIALFLHFQSISSSGLLSLRYPPIYQAFTVRVHL